VILNILIDNIVGKVYESLLKLIKNMCLLF